MMKPTGARKRLLVPSFECSARNVSLIRTPDLRWKARQGFALISVLTLLVLFALLAVGMLSLSSICLRRSSVDKDMAVARANARMALMLAIGDLQKHTGPDQRVTASADISSEVTENGHWTGVWSTTLPTLVDLTKTNFIDDQNPPDPAKGVVTGGANPGRKNIVSENPLDRNYLTDFRNETKSDGSPAYTQKSLMLAWLVSGNPSVSAKPSVSTEGTPHIIMVEKSAGLNDAGDPLYQANRVSAPLVEIHKGTANAGRYAYWVGDESLKARVNLKPTDKQPDANNPTDGGLARLAGAEGPNIRFVKAGTELPYAPLVDLQAAEHKKLITPGELMIPLQSIAPRKNFHDLTTYSESVLADVRDGGLKKDLTSYITKPGTAPVPGIPDIPETGMPDSDSSLLGHPMLPGPLYAKSGPNFLQLRNWYQLSGKVTGGYGKDSSMEPVFLKMRTTPSTFPFAAQYGGVMPDLQSREQSVQPVVAEARIAFDFSLDGRQGGRGLRTHVYPKVKLWNPYNVTLKGRRYLIGFPKYIRMNAPGFGVNRISAPTVNGNDWQFFLTNTSQPDILGQLYFVLESVELQPGECLIFSPRASGESSRYDTNNIVANVLSPSVPAGGTENFYFESDAFLSGGEPANGVTYGVTALANNAHPLRTYLFKDAGKTAGAISNDDAQKSSQFPIIQKLAMDVCGDSGSQYNALPNPGGVSSLPMASSANHVGRPPYSSWYMGARLRWIEENPGELPKGFNNGTPPGGYHIHNPTVREFNIRANVAHRSHFCSNMMGAWWAVGPYINSQADQVITDQNTMAGRMDNGKCLASPFGPASRFPQGTSFVMFDVPRKELPPLSLASFQHAQLGYQAWQPTYLVGHSFASGRADRDSTVMSRFFASILSVAPWDPSTSYYRQFKNNNMWDQRFGRRNGGTSNPGVGGTWNDLIQYTTGEPRELLIYDSCYTVNHALWDRYFLSSLPFDEQGKLKTNGAAIDPVNPRMKVNSYTGHTDAKIRELLAGEHPVDYAAYFLMNEGGFNINSTSVEAWRAFFTSMNDVKRPLRNGAESVAGAFSRILLPGTKEVVSDHHSSGAWDGVRVLTDLDLDRMAVEMVKIIKERGPFLGLSDFVNRRLTYLQYPEAWLAASNSMTGHPSMCGPLQAAIEKAQLNASLQTSPPSAPDDKADPNTFTGNYVNYWGPGVINYRFFSPDGFAMGPWKSQCLPGSLTQADILQSVGANITARGDTFLVRAYGDKCDASGKVVARAWCEAVVQRTPDYLSAKPVEEKSDATANNPLEPVVIHSTKEYFSTLNDKLIPINQKFGRRFVVKSFRWLTPSEV